MSPVKAKPSKRASKDKKNDTKLSSVKMPCLGLKQFKVNLPDDKSKIETTKTKIIDLGMTKDQVVVFVPKSELADMLYDSLREYRFLVSVVHSDLTKQKREKMVDMVVNFDLPVKRDSLDEPDIDLYLLRLPEKGVVFYLLVLILKSYNFYDATGVVFYLLSGDKENMIMEKLERHLDRTITEVPSWESRKDFELAFIEAGIRSRLMNSSPIKKPILTYNGSTSLGNCSTSTKLASHIVGRFSMRTMISNGSLMEDQKWKKRKQDNYGRINLD
ncbi:DEAD-box ATP-dependent RNA helicase 38 [Tanacetum coccineum]